MRARVRKDRGGEQLPPWPALVAATLPRGVAVVSPYDEPDVPAALIKAMASDAVIVLDTPNGELTPVLGLLPTRKAGSLVGCADSAVNRRALLGAGFNVFKVHGAASRLFGATYDLAAAPWVDVIKADPVSKPFAGFEDFGACVSAQLAAGKSQESAERICGSLQAETKKAFDDRPVRLIKTADEGEERLVYGIVLEPNGVDAQDDTISPEEIRQAAHKFMQSYGNVGLQHQTFINGQARILESYIAPADMVIGGYAVRKGTWLMAMRVISDDIWKAVKSGLITGFSIGGSAVRKPA